MTNTNQHTVAGVAAKPYFESVERDLLELQIRNAELLAALESILQTCNDGVIHRNETGKPQWSAFGHMKAIATAALAKVKGQP